MDTQTTAPASLRPWQHAPRVLVVDDDETIRQLTRRILEGHGYKVLTASDGAAALRAMPSAMRQPGTAVHLVLTDIEMPGMDGYALVHQLRLRWPALPVIYMSGASDRGAGRAAPGSPAHFIGKPFSAGDLLPRLDLVLGLAALGAQAACSGQVEARMTLIHDTAAEASEAARAAVAYLGEEERWALLQKWLEKEPAGQRKAGKRSPRLEALRSIVCPRVDDRVWDNILREHRQAHWAGELRLANAFACGRPEPAGRRTSEMLPSLSRGQGAGLAVPMARESGAGP